MNLVIIESPYAGNVDLNTAYARECMKDSLDRGEAPFAPHLLYTQVLDDKSPAERERGIFAGHEWLRRADLVAVYTDRGISQGILEGIAAALLADKYVEARRLYGKEDTP